ncbi:chorismate-binding protein [Flavobacteriaceae bacterium]|nr:chorismate-binding protein [Flavobacteriaceae bacterium]
MKSAAEKVSNNNFFETINTLVSAKKSFFCSRLPDSKRLMLFSGNTKKIPRSKIKGNGIFIMPFNEKNLGYKINPSLTYETKIEHKLNSNKNSLIRLKEIMKNEDEESYKLSIEKLINEIRLGKLSKIVFSKKITLDYFDSNQITIFKNILDLYSEAFCYLFYNPSEGFWMGASPELLFKTERDSVSTMALAGTKFNINSDWGDKEYSEQKIVQDEIFENLKPLCNSLITSEIETISAGKIQHLKTDFKGTTRASTIQLINVLFPTSAVAGYPRIAALKLLSKHEEHERSLYSGFLGTCQDDSSSFFVNLRCLNIKDDTISLYVGSGITKDSVPENEWIEILKKSETMLSAIF